MKIADEKSDAIQIIHDLKTEMNNIRQLLAELEYLVYEKDERAEIIFFERGENGEGREEESEKRVTAD